MIWSIWPHWELHSTNIYKYLHLQYWNNHLMRSAQMSEQISISACDRKAIDIVPLCSYHLQRPANKSQRLRASKSCNHVQIENHMKIHGLDRSFLSLPFWNFVALDDSGNSPCTRPAWMATPFPRNWLRCSSSSPEIRIAWQIQCFLPQCWREKNKNQVIKLYVSHGEHAFFPASEIFNPTVSIMAWRILRCIRTLVSFFERSSDGGDSAPVILWRFRMAVWLSYPCFDRTCSSYIPFTRSCTRHLQCFVPLSWAPPAPFNSYERSNGSCNCSNSWYASLVPTSAFSVKSMPCLKLLCVQKAKSASSSQIASILQAQCPSQVGPG